MDSLSLDELAVRAEVDTPFVRRLIAVGALERPSEAGPYGPAHVRRVQLLRTWEAAGFSAEAVVDLVRAGEISLSWLDSPVTTGVERLDVTYEQLCGDADVPLDLAQAIQEALGFAPPNPGDRARVGDRDLMELIGTVVAAGASRSATLRVLRVFADSLRRITKAEAELYESEVERPMREAGRSEQQLLDFGAGFGDLVMPLLERALLDIYRRHREHVWVEHRIVHAEVALERAGIRPRVSRPPAICFVDLTGYTRLTEERGDEVAAGMATGLASLVEDTSRRHGGRPIRWLGDGGMFYFKEPGAAVLSGLDMVESAPAVGLPPLHIGIHAGPVVFQDGDVYGRTVNLASRIASSAGAGEVLASDETVRRFAHRGVRFEPRGPVTLKGIARPVSLHRAVRDPRA
jgi:class 3 adenylate cyclase